MASSNKTLRKLLNLFSDGDRFDWDDYNADMLKIDAGLNIPHRTYEMEFLAGKTYTTNNYHDAVFDKTLNKYGGAATNSADESYIVSNEYLGVKVPSGYTTAVISGIWNTGGFGGSNQPSMILRIGTWNGSIYNFDYAALGTGIGTYPCLSANVVVSAGQVISMEIYHNESTSWTVPTNPTLCRMSVTLM